MVVDDTAANLQLLTSMLRRRGYRVRLVASGEIALGAVEAHGGAVGLESAPGQGSTFWFTVPVGRPVEETSVGTTAG